MRDLQLSSPPLCFICLQVTFSLSSSVSLIWFFAKCDLFLIRLSHYPIAFASAPFIGILRNACLLFLQTIHEFNSVYVVSGGYNESHPGAMQRVMRDEARRGVAKHVVLLFLLLLLLVFILILFAFVSCAETFIRSIHIHSYLARTARICCSTAPISYYYLPFDHYFQYKYFEFEKTQFLNSEIKI